MESPEESPCVSVCIPTYNGKEYLNECIASILAQTFTDFEVVVCDDESSDGTLEIAQQLADEDPRFRVIANPRRFGLVGNWNNCIEQARGEWIKFVFQDDIIMPSCIEKLISACSRENKLFGFCERNFIFEDGVPDDLRNWFDLHKSGLRADYQAGPVIEPEQAANIIVRQPSHNLAGEPTVTLINSSVFRELGRFDEALIQLCDAEFWDRLMINDGAAFVPENLAAFRVHANATTILNHGKRTFRLEVLDPLVLRYRFAFGRHFGPVRNPRLSGRSIWSLRREFAAAAAQAWRQAVNARRAGDSSLLKEWRSVRSHCFGLQTLARLGLALEMFVRLKRRITGRSGLQP
jgi:glycosyltransferase involved in cell wall biosynthesis